MANQSIERAAQILSLFSYARPQLRVSQIAKELNLPVGTVHGLVRTLEQTGLLGQDSSSKKYHLGMQLHILGSILMATMELNQKASIPLGYLAKEYNMVGRLGIFHHDAIVVTLNTPPLSSGPMAPYTGASAPAHCTCMGKAILAHMDQAELKAFVSRVELAPYTPHTIVDKGAFLAEIGEIARRGYSICRQEYLLQLMSVGAAIIGQDGKPVGAICINSDPQRMEQVDLAALAGAVMDTAGEISRYMGYYPTPRYEMSPSV